eukprot:m.61425 g.61425  ORF g.61425 m.61425 type:complete len:737 (-) comp11865_c0_seq1:261-2471(-)
MGKLLEAVRLGQLEEVQQLLAKLSTGGRFKRKSPKDINNADEAGMTPLHYSALSKESSEITSVLLAGGAEPDSVDVNGMTPLHHAAWSDNAKGVQLLLKAGASSSCMCSKGKTPLVVACESGSIHAFNQLLEYGSDVTVLFGNMSLFELACKNGKAAIVARLLQLQQDEGMTVHAHHWTEPFPQDGTMPPETTPIHMAIATGSLDLVTLLIEAGFDLNYPSVRGSPLQYAAILRKFAITCLLLSRNATTGFEGEPEQIQNLDALREQYALHESSDPQRAKVGLDICALIAAHAQKTKKKAKKQSRKLVDSSSATHADGDGDGDDEVEVSHKGEEGEGGVAEEGKTTKPTETTSSAVEEAPLEQLSDAEFKQALDGDTLNPQQEQQEQEQEQQEACDEQEGVGCHGAQQKDDVAVQQVDEQREGGHQPAAEGEQSSVTPVKRKRRRQFKVGSEANKAESTASCPDGGDLGDGHGEQPVLTIPPPPSMPRPHSEVVVAMAPSVVESLPPVGKDTGVPASTATLIEGVMLKAPQVRGGRRPLLSSARHRWFVLNNLSLSYYTYSQKELGKVLVGKLKGYIPLDTVTYVSTASADGITGGLSVVIEHAAGKLFARASCDEETLAWVSAVQRAVNDSQGTDEESEPRHPTVPSAFDPHKVYPISGDVPPTCVSSSSEESSDEADHQRSETEESGTFAFSTQPKVDPEKALLSKDTTVPMTSVASLMQNQLTETDETPQDHS